MIRYPTSRQQIEGTVPTAPRREVQGSDKQLQTAGQPQWSGHGSGVQSSDSKSRFAPTAPVDAVKNQLYSPRQQVMGRAYSSSRGVKDQIHSPRQQIRGRAYSSQSRGQGSDKQSQTAGQGSRLQPQSSGQGSDTQSSDSRSRVGPTAPVQRSRIR